jgi:hypothetical protein
MKYASRQPPSCSVSCEDVTASLFDVSNASAASADVVFVSERGVALGGVKELSDKSRSLLRSMQSVFTKKFELTEELVKLNYFLQLKSPF